MVGLVLGPVGEQLWDILVVDLEPAEGVVVDAGGR
jgi:hypothetical protein